MAAVSTNILATADRLKGRENYVEWKFQMTNLLKLDGLWTCIAGYPQGDETPADRKSRQDEMALSKISLSIEKQVFTYVTSATTAKEAWKALENAFEDKGLHRRLQILRKLCSIKLKDFNSMQEYVNEAMTLAQQLTTMGKPIDDEFLGVIMLQGLPQDYEPMVMALENSLTEITSNFVKLKLLQDDKWNSKQLEEGERALVSKPFRKSHKKPYCWNCHQPGHYKNNCFKKNREQAKQNEGKKDDKKALLTAFSAFVHSDSSWFVDSGATTHMTPRKDWLINHNNNDCIQQEICVGNGEKLKCHGTGEVLVDLNEKLTKTIKDVMYVPELTANLLSVSTLTERGYCVVFDNNRCTLYDSEQFHVKGDVVTTASKTSGMYRLDTVNTKVQNCALTTSMNMHELWHKRLGHLNRKSMGLLRDGYVTGVSFKKGENSPPCQACLKGKQARQPFPRSEHKLADNKLVLIHTDVAGPMHIESYSGHRYFLTFIDDYSRKVFVYFLKTKNEVIDKFIEFKALVENQTDRKIKCIRSDNGGEFCNNAFKSILKKSGIEHQTTVPKTPQQNGVSERYNRTIMEKVRSMIDEANSDSRLWAEAVNTAVYLINRSPTKKLNNVTPEERWSGRKIDLSHLRIFGCVAHVHIHDQDRRKLSPKSKKGILVGYSETSKGYRIFNPSTHSVTIARDVVFDENEFTNCSSSSTNQSTSAPIVNIPTHEVVEEITADGEDSEHSVPDEEYEETPSSEDSSEYVPSDGQDDHQVEISNPRYPQRLRKAKEYPDFVSYLCSSFEEPLCYEDAKSSSDNDKWESAMKRELDSLKESGTWVLVDKPSNCNIVRNKWVYKIKRNSNNEIVKYKARLVAKGFTQQHGVDYDETFSPVIRHTNIRLLFALAVKLDLNIDHLDIETAFLNGSLDETIYMYQPEGFIDTKNKDKVCLLKKTIYGLKQSSRVWYKTVEEFLVNLGYVKSLFESCVYYKRNGCKLTIVALYVDDFLILSNDMKEKSRLKYNLGQKFNIKDLGEVKYFLGLNIERTKGQIKINQKPYINNLLRKFNMSQCKTVTTPIEANCKLNNVSQELPNVPYQSLIGSLMYLAVNSRPDIAYVISYLSQFNTKFTSEHWKAAKRVLQYLKGTIDYSLIYRNDDKKIVGYADADWANGADRKSYSGFVFMLSEGPISWEAKKQNCVALSSTEAEYIAITQASKEATYLREFLGELIDFKDPIIIYNDNQSAQKLVYNPVYHNRTKHIDIKYHYVREIVNKNYVKIEYMATQEMIADIFTKGLHTTKHMFCTKNLNIMN